MSKGRPLLPDEWRLHPTVVKWIMAWFMKQPQHPLSTLVFHGPVGQSSPGGGCVRSCALAKETSLCPPITTPHPSPVGEGEAGAVVSHLGGSGSPVGTMVRRDDPHAGGSASDRPPRVWGGLSQAGGMIGTLPALGQHLRVWYTVPQNVVLSRWTLHELHGGQLLCVPVCVIVMCGSQSTDWAGWVIKMIILTHSGWDAG